MGVDENALDAPRFVTLALIKKTDIKFEQRKKAAKSIDSQTGILIAFSVMHP